MVISKEIRQQVRERAKYLCEYCHSSEEASAARFEIDRIQPRSLGGLDTLENLALACQRCNSYVTTSQKVLIRSLKCRLRVFQQKNDPEPELFKSCYLTCVAFVSNTWIFIYLEHSKLFNPRLHQWNEHFIWKKGGLVIRGKTPIGRATCDRLDLNDQEHNEEAIVKARRLWIQGGWHPPSGDAKLFDI